MSHTPKNAPRATSGEPSRTAQGSRQLSYIAASSRNTNTIARMNVGPGGGATFSWYDRLEYAKPISLGIVAAKTSSSAARAWPDEKPRPGTPLISTDRNRLKRVVISVLATDVIVTSVDSGIMLPPVRLRTYTSPMSEGFRR